MWRLLMFLLLSTSIVACNNSKTSEPEPGLTDDPRSAITDGTMVSDSTFTSVVSEDLDVYQVGTSSRFDPVPFGKTALTLDGLAITGVTIDPDPWPNIQNADSSNQPPAAGKRMVIVRLEVENIDAASEPAEVDNSYFVLIGSENIMHYNTIDPDANCGKIPDELQVRLGNGEAISGNLCWQIPENETDLVLIYQVEFQEDVVTSDVYLEVPVQ